MVRYRAREFASSSQSASSARRLRLQLGAHCVPKSSDGPGEDAYFASQPLSAFGLADGVGSWAREGIDAGIFSRSLLRHTHAGLRQRAQGAPLRPDLPGIARLAFEAVRGEGARGSCTLLLGQLHLDTLAVMNIGDCGLMALRPVEIKSRFVGGTPQPSLRLVYRSSPMLHRPNMPLQLSSEDRDTTESLSQYDLVTLQLRLGDYIIAGTDGLFDNVADRELRSLVLKHQGSAPELAAIIGQQAAERARVPQEFSFGGKLDDIAVIVARVEEGNRSVGGSLLDNLED